MHIGKTGGSAVKSSLKNHLKTPEGTLVLHGHNVSLQDISDGEEVIFFLRDPTSRFISGFYSRQRKGQPRYYSEWNSREKAAFEVFKTPNDFACALADGKLDAIEAMENIAHLKQYNTWYHSIEYFKSRSEDILFIGFQESLDRDFTTLKSCLTIHDSCSLPTDDIGAHRNPVDIDKSIEERGMSALKDWYQEDYMFLSLCKEIMSNKVLHPSR